MKIQWNWGVFFRGLLSALDDVRANRKPKPKPPATNADAAAALKALQARLPAIIAALEAHPGLTAGADDLLRTLAQEGVDWAAPLESAVDGAPAVLGEAESWLPWVLPWLGGAFAAAPSYPLGSASRGR